MSTTQPPKSQKRKHDSTSAEPAKKLKYSEMEDDRVTILTDNLGNNDFDDDDNDITNNDHDDNNIKNKDDDDLVMI